MKSLSSPSPSGVCRNNRQEKDSGFCPTGIFACVDWDRNHALMILYSIHWSCAPKKPAQPSSPLLCTPYTIRQLQKDYLATGLPLNTIMHIWLILSDPLEYALQILRMGAPGILTILTREFRGNCEKLKFTAFSSPFLSVLARFSWTSKEWSVSKDSGIWLTDYVLSLSFLFFSFLFSLLNVKWLQRQYKTPRTADVSKWDLLFTGNCLSLL